MKTLVFYFSILLMVVVTSCASNSSETGHEESVEIIAKDVTATEFKNLLSSKEGTIIDARTPQETAGGMIDGAINIDYLSGDFENKVSSLDKNKPVYIYCASGGRSASAMEDLTVLGFKEVYNLLGGYKGWK